MFTKKLKNSAIGQFTAHSEWKSVCAQKKGSAPIFVQREARSQHNLLNIQSVYQLLFRQVNGIVALLSAWVDARDEHHLIGRSACALEGILHILV